MQIENDATQALSWADVDRAFQAETGSQDRREVVRRLISQAARGTRRKTPSAVLPVDQADYDQADYEEALRRAVARTRQVQTQLTQEKRDAERLWHLLESHAPSRRGMLIRNDRRFQTWGLYECLRERSQSLLEREPEAAIQAAELALAAARGLSTAQYGEESVYDFQGTALVALAQARRGAGDLEGAATALGQAGLMLSMGTGDLLEKAEARERPRGPAAGPRPDRGSRGGRPPGPPLRASRGRTEAGRPGEPGRDPSSPAAQARVEPKDKNPGGPFSLSR